MVKKLYQLMLLVIVGLTPTIASADQCVRHWHNMSAERIAGFQLWAESWQAYEPRRDRYDAEAWAQAILVNHVRPNCAAQLQALGIDESQYIGHLIYRNFPLPGNTYPRYISQQDMINVLATTGLDLGLPQLQTSPATRSAPAATNTQRRQPAPVRRTPVIPGCPSCMTTNSD